MNIFILDDEPAVRETIRAFLQTSGIDRLVIKEADSLKGAKEALESFEPGLAILDINLGDGTSFELLRGYESIPFKIIFVSAYDEYAIKAFRFNALDYLLKPMSSVDFQEAIDRAITIATPPSDEQLNGLDQSLKRNISDKLILKDHQNVYVVKIKEIVCCRSENNYTIFSLSSEEEIVISKTLGDYEELLSEHGFFRAHRSCLINLDEVKKYERKEGSIRLTNGHRVPLAKHKREWFLRLLERM